MSAEDTGHEIHGWEADVVVRCIQRVYVEAPTRAEAARLIRQGDWIDVASDLDYVHPLKATIKGRVVGDQES